MVQRPLKLGVPEIQVPDVRAAMATAAAAFYGDPTATLRAIGVTGTNGKTTTAFLVRSLLEADGRQTGLLGTVKSVIGGTEHEVQRTTPEAIELQRDFRAMLDGADVACAMEVSSHALELHRADAVHFAVSIFTNLTQDHLDFHPAMDSSRPSGGCSWSSLGCGGKRRRSVRGAPGGGAGAPGRVRARSRRELPCDERRDPPVRLAVRRPDARRGRARALATARALQCLQRARRVCAARALGVSAETCAQAIATAGQVPGRFETIDAGQPFAVVVDYAHTPDSLDNVLRSARELVTSPGARLHVVFCAGGDRDRGKRPLMGEIATRLADRVIVTSDNPRSEDPEAIIEEILAGSGLGVEHDADRRAAIERAIATAEPGDVVVIAGKGHEQGQEFADGLKLPFDGVAVARELLSAIADKTR